MNKLDQRRILKKPCQNQKCASLDKFLKETDELLDATSLQGFVAFSNIH